MSPLDWLGATCIACLVLSCCDWWYRRLDATLTAKLKLDEAKADALDRICGRLEVIGNELAEYNANYTTDDDSDDDEWRLN